MLLLVPSNKIDEGTGKIPSPFSRVLVVLPPDTDLSSNVIVPDTAITTTLGTSDTLDLLDDASPFSSNRAAFLDLTRQARDHLGIQKPSNPNIHIRLNSLQQMQQPNVQCLKVSLDGQRQGHPYEPGENFNRTRRHSHTGLVDTDHGASATSCYRTRSRQPSSCNQPYHHQPVRTPRALRAAFRKARRDQSPVLTSGAFATDYTTANSSSTLINADKIIPQRTMSESMQSSPRRTLSQSVISVHPLQQESENCNGLIVGYVEDEKIICCSEQMGLQTAATKATAALLEEHHREQSEDLDVDGLSDAEMGSPSELMEPETFGLARSHHNLTLEQRHVSTKESGLDRADLDIDFDNDLDADMNMILGMASDMELVMPKFDDEYLDDLRNDPVLVSSSRRASVVSSASPSCSNSSCTTITCISSHPSPESRLASPRAASVDTAPVTMNSSPPVVTVKAQSQPPIGTLGTSTSHGNSMQRDISTIHKDIDNLRRHRDSLRRNCESAPDASPPPDIVLSTSSNPIPQQTTLPSSSSSSSNSSANEQKPSIQEPIYFKPTHHTLPERIGTSEYQRQSVMIIQSNLWACDNTPPTGTRTFPPPLEPGTLAKRSNVANHIFTIQESLPVPLPSLDKSAIMTTNNISLATANMNVLTPQEVQEDYYARRSLRASQQRRRRRSSVMSAAIAQDANRSNASAPFRVEGFSPVPGPLRSTSRPAFFPGVHPFDTSTMPVPAIGPTPIPASYYIPPSAFRTEADVAAEREAERKRKQEEEDLKESFLVFPSPSLA